MKYVLSVILALFLVLMPISTLAATTITVGATSYQTFVGWQATAQTAHQYKVLPGGTTYEWPSTTYSNYKTNILNAMLDLGINSLRLEANLADVNATGYDDNSNNAAIQPSTATSGQWHYDRVTSAMDDIAVPYAALLAAQGETLDLSLCIVDFKTTGYKAEDTPSEYSFFVKKFVDKIFTTYGIKVNTIEAILEPEADSGSNSNWTAAKVANGIVQANTDLIAAGYTGIRWKAPSVNSAANATTWYANMKSANASVTPLLDELPYHRYHGTNADVAAFQAAALADGKTTAMLEYISAGAGLLYDDLTIGHNSSWQQFTVTFPYPGSLGDGGQYFFVDSTTYAVSYNEPTKYLRSFMKYVRNGAVMKSVTNTGGTSFGVPFVNSNGTYVVPIKSGGDVITVAGLPNGTYGIRYTTGNGASAPSAYDQALANQTVSGGSNVVFTMPAAGYATVYNVNYMTPTLTCRYFFSTKITGCP